MKVRIHSLSQDDLPGIPVASIHVRSTDGCQTARVASLVKLPMGDGYVLFAGGSHLRSLAARERESLVRFVRRLVPWKS